METYLIAAHCSSEPPLGRNLTVVIEAANPTDARRIFREFADAQGLVVEGPVEVAKVPEQTGTPGVIGHIVMTPSARPEPPKRTSLANYLAYCGRAPVNEYSLSVSEDGKTIRLSPDEIIACDDHALHAELISYDDKGKHEMIRSFMGQRVRITVEAEG